MIPDKARRLKTGYYICGICEYDKFHISIEGGKEFVSCANCGVRTDIQVMRDGSELKLVLS